MKEKIDLSKIDPIDSQGKLRRSVHTFTGEENSYLGNSTLSVDTVYDLKFFDGDTIPQVILDIRCNGDIYYKEVLIESDKELASALREIVSGTMESRLRVKELEREVLDLNMEIEKLKDGK